MVLTVWAGDVLETVVQQFLRRANIPFQTPYFISGLLDRPRGRRNMISAQPFGPSHTPPLRPAFMRIVIPGMRLSAAKISDWVSDSFISPASRSTRLFMPTPLILSSDTKGK